MCICLSSIDVGEPGQVAYSMARAGTLKQGSKNYELHQGVALLGCLALLEYGLV